MKNWIYENSLISISKSVVLRIFNEFGNTSKISNISLLLGFYTIYFLNLCRRSLRFKRSSYDFISSLC